MLLITNLKLKNDSFSRKKTWKSSLPYTLFFLLSFLFTSEIPIKAQNTLDDRIIRNIYTNRNQKLDKSLTSITRTISPVVISSVLIIPIGYSKKMTWNWKTALFIGGSSLGSSLLSYGTKKLIKRDRPYEVNPTIKPLDSPNSRSFPSGHTTAAFNLATNIALLHPKKWYVIVPAYMYSGVIGYSRLHLGVHYASDVLAGAVLGTGTAIGLHALVKPKSKHDNVLSQ
ncbi:MAG: phosphatase PAP2 family protein [Leadbetterella sp.]